MPLTKDLHRDCDPKAGRIRCAESRRSDYGACQRLCWSPSRPQHDSGRSVWPLVANLTLRMLLSMQGGLSDYNDEIVRKIGIEDPLRDITPQDYLSNVSIVNCSAWRCHNASSLEPPTYNSVGYLSLWREAI